MIPYAQQQITEEDIAAVTAALRSDRVTQGPVVPRFEAAMAGRCGADHALAVNSGTAALHLACLALEIGPGDTVWTSPITFVASANCARYCGADVDFVDIDPETGNMSVPALAEKLEQAKRTGRLPKALIPVHLAGTPCDMAEIGALARRYGVAVIEDASHAVGATRDGAPVGACTHSDLAVFSFHPVKIITTGEGGMALTNEPELDPDGRVAQPRHHPRSGADAACARRAMVLRADRSRLQLPHDGAAGGSRLESARPARGLSRSPPRLGDPL